MPTVSMRPVYIYIKTIVNRELTVAKIVFQIASSKRQLLQLAHGLLRKAEPSEFRVKMLLCVLFLSWNAWIRWHSLMHQFQARPVGSQHALTIVRWRHSVESTPPTKWMTNRWGQRRFRMLLILIFDERFCSWYRKPNQNGVRLLVFDMNLWLFASMLKQCHGGVEWCEDATEYRHPVHAQTRPIGSAFSQLLVTDFKMTVH